jgi:exportin-T
VRSISENLIRELFPSFLKCFADEWDEISNTVYPFTERWLFMIKTAKKVQDGELSNSQISMLSSLLQAILHKTKYQLDQEPYLLPTTASSGDIESDLDEDLAIFLRERQQLKVFFDNIAYTHFPTWCSYTMQVISDVFKRQSLYANGSGPPLAWNEVELSLHLMYLFGEGVKVAASSGNAGIPTGKKLTEQGFVSASGELTPLGDLMTQTLTCGISSYSHPCVGPLLQEIAVRYAQFFIDFPQYLPEALQFFVDQRGLHSPHLSTRSRASYLFHRFIKVVKSKVAAYVNQALVSMQDLLVVPLPKAEQPVSPGEKNEDDSKVDLSLFEAVGLLISLEEISFTERGQYLQVVLTPLLQSLNEVNARVVAAFGPNATNGGSPNPFFTTQACYARNLISAVGSVAKEFPNRTSFKNMNPPPPWVPIFSEANQVVLNTLNVFREDEQVRDATRFAFQRVISVMGHEALPLLPPLTQTLLCNCTLHELPDVLGFLGLMLFSYKGNIGEFMESLIETVLSIVFNHLNVEPTGTDEELLHLDLKRAYLSLLGSIFTTQIDYILLSATNFSLIGGVLNSIVACTMTLEKTVQRTAINLLAKITSAWV